MKRRTTSSYGMNNQQQNNVVELKATNVFYRNAESIKRYVINRGGAGSSKSYSLAQHIFINKFLGEEDKHILILRKTLPSLRLSTLMIIKGLIRDLGLGDIIKEDKSFLNYYYFKDKKRFNFIHFGSVDDPEKVKSTDWNYIWMEEATEFTLQDFNTLKLRLRRPSVDNKPNQLFMSFNPIDAFHWIKTEVLEKQPEKCTEIVSSYKDNPFLDEEYIEELETLQTLNPNLHRVYALGQWGRAEYTIFDNYRVVNSVPDSYDEHFYGLDFGSTNPCALTEVIIKDMQVFVVQRLYERIKTNKELIERLDSLELDRRAEMYCDSAEPKRIAELYEAGYNAHSADKDVLNGIDFVQRIPLNIHVNSVDLIKELGAYSWKVDRRGIVLEEPVKYNDHLIDSVRYAIYTHLAQRREYTFAFVHKDVEYMQQTKKLQHKELGKAESALKRKREQQQVAVDKKNALKAEMEKREKLHKEYEEKSIEEQMQSEFEKAHRKYALHI